MFKSLLAFLKTRLLKFTITTSKTGYIKPKEKRVDLSNRILTISRPVSIKFPVSSPYGWRQLEGKRVFHNGVDFKTPENTPLYACDDGIIFRSGWESEADHGKGFGYRIWQSIRVEDYQFFLWYGHTSKILVHEGDKVKRGDHIGFTGNTGHSTGPHLHFGIRLVDTSEWWQPKFSEIT